MHRSEQISDDQKRVWLIGGTQESVQLAIALTRQSLPYVVSVTTPAATQLYPAEAQVCVGQLGPGEMSIFIQQQGIGCILDASHPFAQNVSTQAIATGLPYLRFEREALTSQPTITSESKTLVTVVNSLNELINSELLLHQTVLFTIGYRYLSKFAALRQTSKLFARILPSSEAIAGTLAAGFSSKEIIAIRPPISHALEAALWRQWQITTVVAKASGTAGGEAVKRQVSAQLGIPLILIARPQIQYPCQTNSVPEAVKFCLKTRSMP